MKRYFLYAALLLLTQCSKCKKDDPQPQAPVLALPAETQNGARTFGCLINGQVWLPSTGLFSPTLTAEYLSFPDHKLLISAINSRKPPDQVIAASHQIKQYIFFFEI